MYPVKNDTKIKWSNNMNGSEIQLLAQIAKLKAERASLELEVEDNGETEDVNVKEVEGHLGEEEEDDDEEDDDDDEVEDDDDEDEEDDEDDDEDDAGDAVMVEQGASSQPTDDQTPKIDDMD